MGDLTKNLSAQAQQVDTATRYVPIADLGDAGVNGTITLAVRRQKDGDDLTDRVDTDRAGVPYLFVQTGGRYTYRVPALAALVAAPVIESLSMEDIASAIAEAGLEFKSEQEEEAH